MFKVALPYLKQAKELGCESFVECTPAYLGRDVGLLKRLSEATGIRILTNTGYYGAADDRFVPAHAYEETADQLADRWVREWETGIEGTGIRPGFIKIGVDKMSLSEIDRKLVRAAKGGAWIAFDGISSGKMGLILNHVKAMKAAGVLDQVLLSHDAGWYRPGEPGGGKFRAYDLVFTEFLPALKGDGFSDEEIHLLTVENPKRAFAVQVRARS